VHLDRAKAVGRIDRFLDQYLPAALIAQAEPLEIGAWALPGEPVPFAEARRGRRRGCG
jgi:alpha-mannosidase